ncbi:WD40-repeat-containing domain protein [Lophiotrema nucula]|uniref:Mitochondrial division protein 1 n=1 Tax=Lophiotrema nucula TaxID=690887 RepID=A0A6A5YI91_9PLEO|nr:WD40-repeat-containing domain protein [Lophiotrema nucula]
MSTSDPSNSGVTGECTAGDSIFRIPRADQQDDAHTNRIYCLRVSPNFLVTGGYDRTVRVWSKSSRSLALPPLTGYQSSVLSVEVSEDLDVICSGDGDGQILIWSLSKGNLLSTDRTAKLWQILGDDAEHMRLSHRHTLTGHEWSILASQIHNGRAVTSSKDCVRVWSLEDRSCLEVISNFSCVSDFQVIPESGGLQIVGSCTDSHARIIDLANEKELACLSGHVGVARIAKVHVSPLVPGYRIVSAGWDGTVRLWTLDAGGEKWQCIRVIEFSDAVLTPFGKEVELFEIEGEEFIDVKNRAKRVFDMQIDGTVAYVVGEGAEIVAFDLDVEEAD